ncbi:MAG: hypothetical protein ACKOC6_08310, partial [bacterium]
MRPVLSLPLIALALVLGVVPASALTIERVVTFDPARLQVTTDRGRTRVSAAGGMPEFGAGRPDLPWVSERVDLPAGMRIERVEVVGLETAPLREAVRVAAAPVLRPGAGPEERTEADAAVYSV